MNPFFDIIVRNGLLLDALGILGLGLIGLSAVRLARRHRSWGGNLMATGAIGLLVARLFILSRPLLMEAGLFDAGNLGRIASILPPLLLTLGLAGIVWGVWAHERWIRETR